MKTIIRISILLVLVHFCEIGAQEPLNLAQKLGYPRDAKLLIVHADDIGLAQSVNTATIRAFEKGGITSGSVMVPCPWFPDFAEYFKAHSDLDVGIHITLTAEWQTYKWAGVSPSDKIPSLLDENGFFYPSVEAVGLNADPGEAELEIRAQIDRAIAFGIKPTHLDTHMGSVGAKPELTQIYLKLGKEHGLPILIPRFWIEAFPQEARSDIERNNVILDALFMLDQEPPSGMWDKAYEEMIGKMVPGLNQMIVHLGIDNDELKAVAVNHPDYGATWRQKDLDYVTSLEFREALKNHDVQLVTWKEIKEVM